ncbi:ABC transporter permease [Salinibacterium sp. SWN1162]|uniref:ABC transporter permease n=1 Tax=Salinibacterium sp. SWN1162 TaxID=2792053 RepID=UPI0018CFA28C|nr:ABC transporter permease [Salinibacterium sp. SWN1162]MBH0009524.1 ABC transporter permease [Salinibacterium sp. SWN1162]
MNATTAQRPSPHFSQSVALVAEREILARLRSKSFLITTGILFLLVLGGVIAGGIFSKSLTTIPVAVVTSVSAVVENINGLDVTVVDDRREAEELVINGTVDAAIVPAPDGSRVPVSIIADTEAPASLVQVFSITPDVVMLNPSEASGSLTYLIAIGFGMIFFISGMTFGPMIAQSVVEEKQTRIVEILMSAVPVSALMAGKVIGNSILAFAQIIAIAGLAVIGLWITGQTDLLSLLSAPLLWFVGFFIIGFVLLAALFAAVGAMVSRQEDLGSAMTPVTMLIMLPYFAIIFFNDNPVALAVMSYIPFSAPVGMPMRLFIGTAEWWEPLVALALLLITALLAVLLGSRIYNNSLLKVGSRVRWAEAIKR